MTELYTNMRYLQYNTLQRLGLGHFDSWAASFGETQTAIELAPEGTGYRAKTRFAKFFNLPELIALFKESADIQTPDMLKLPVPEAEYENIVLKPSEHQKEMVQSLAGRAEAVRDRKVDATVDNMLKITNDGRKLALDQRLINDMLPDEENSKATTCVEKAFEIWEQTKEQKSAQLIFCDLSTPKGDGTFNVYEDIRDKLMAKGVPEQEIAFIHDANTETRKAELFAKVRSGQVRFLLGSTAKMGAGTNVQDRLIALHHLDVPWRPSDIEQQEGRILRQGNMNDKVKIFRYVTEGTFDSYSWQLIENKQKFIGQIMTSKSPVRSCEDIDEAALTYAEVKALATGNPYIKEKMDLDIQVSKLKLLKANHTSQKYRLEDNIVKNYPAQIAAMKERLEGYRADIQTYQQNKFPDKDTFYIKIGNRAYTNKKEAGTALIDMCRSAKQPDMAVTIGEYQGFMMNVTFDSFLSRFKVNLKGSISHEVEIGADPLGNLQRLSNALDGMDAKMETLSQQLENVEHQLETAKVEVIKPFAQEEELAEKLERLAELNSLLNMDEKSNDAIGMEGDTFESELEEHNFVLNDADFIGSSGLQEKYRVGLEYIIENVQREYTDEQKRVDIITGYNNPLRPFVMEDENHRIEVMPVKENPKEMLAYINSLKEEGYQVFYHFLNDVNSLINPQKFPLGKSNATYLTVKFSKCATGFSHIYVDTGINQVKVIENKMAFVETPTITCEWSEHPAFENGRTYSVLEFDSLMRKCDEEWSDGYRTALKKCGSVDAMFDAGDIAYVGYAKIKFTVNMPDGSHITERQDIGDGVGGVIDFLKQYPQYKDVARKLQQAVNREENRNEIGRKASVKGL